MELAVLLVPEHMAPDIRLYIASQRRVFTVALGSIGDRCTLTNYQGRLLLLMRMDL